MAGTAGLAELVPCVFSVRPSQIVPGQHVTWLDRERPLTAGYCACVVLQLDVCAADVVVSTDVRGVEGQRLAGGFDGVRPLATTVVLQALAHKLRGAYDVGCGLARGREQDGAIRADIELGGRAVTA